MRISPSPGCFSGTSTNKKSLSSGMPTGRLRSTISRFDEVFNIFLQMKFPD
jgi:hypothetical protein